MATGRLKCDCLRSTRNDGATRPADPLVLWSSGPLVFWSSGPLVRWSPGLLIVWSFMWPYGTGTFGRGPYCTGQYGAGPFGTGPYKTRPHGARPYGKGRRFSMVSPSYWRWFASRFLFYRSLGYLSGAGWFQHFFSSGLLVLWSSGLLVLWSSGQTKAT